MPVKQPKPHRALPQLIQPHHTVLVFHVIPVTRVLVRRVTVPHAAPPPRTEFCCSGLLCSGFSGGGARRPHATPGRRPPLGRGVRVVGGIAACPPLVLRACAGFIARVAAGRGGIAGLYRVPPAGLSRAADQRPRVRSVRHYPDGRRERQLAGGRAPTGGERLRGVRRAGWGGGGAQHGPAGARHRVPARGAEHRTARPCRRRAAKTRRAAGAGRCEHAAAGAGGVGPAARRAGAERADVECRPRT
mmetsp:Transcript_35196/g.112062  ORF Transcript_35196/g.112062 Transcript_35196/m.112062 type:complete len:246 (+) Transcript_35196:570-1307(+)